MFGATFHGATNNMGRTEAGQAVPLYPDEDWTPLVAAQPAFAAQGL